MARNNLSPIMSLFTPCVIANRLQIIIEALSVFLSDFMDFVNYRNLWGQTRLFSWLNDVLRLARNDETGETRHIAYYRGTCGKKHSTNIVSDPILQIS